MSEVPGLPFAYSHLTGLHRMMVLLVFWAKREDLTRKELAKLLECSVTTLVNRYSTRDLYGCLTVLPVRKGDPRLDLPTIPSVLEGCLPIFKPCGSRRRSPKSPVAQKRKRSSAKTCQYWLTPKRGEKAVQCGRLATHGPYCECCHKRSSPQPNPYRREALW